jgi:hypothetical protein
MTDHTPQQPTPAAPNSSILSEAERHKIDQLTAKADGRYLADAQNQALLERALRWFRALVMRRDGNRWRISKTKVLAFVTLGAAAIAFWNYYPRPKLENAFQAPAISIGSSMTTPTPSSSDVVKPAPSSSVEPAVIAAPPRLPVPRAKVAQDLIPQTNSSNTASTPSYDPYESNVTPPIKSSAQIALTSPTLPSSFSTPSLPSLEPDLPRLPPIAPKPSFHKRSSSVAPAPKPLVEQRVTPLTTPKPLVDQVQSSSIDAAPISQPEIRDTTEPLAVNQDPNPQPRETESLGEAGALVDVQNNNKQTPSDAVNPLVNSSAASSETEFNGVLFDTAQTKKQTDPSSSSLYIPGTRLGAKLVLGLVVVQGQESPVVALLEDGAFAFGKASLTSAGRVQISLLEVSKNNTSQPVNGTALSADGFPGVTAQVREDGPDVVSKLFNAGLQGASNYLQGVLQGATTTILNGATTVNSPQPNLGLNLLQSLAQAFLNPQGQQAIKYAQLEPNTPFQVLFLPK